MTCVYNHACLPKVHVVLTDYRSHSHIRNHFAESTSSRTKSRCTHLQLETKSQILSLQHIDFTFQIFRCFALAPTTFSCRETILFQSTEFLFTELLLAICGCRTLGSCRSRLGGVFRTRSTTHVARWNQGEVDACCVIVVARFLLMRRCDARSRINRMTEEARTDQLKLKP